MIAAEEPKETVVIAQDPKDEAVVVVEEPKEVRDMKALQQAYAFAIPYAYAAAPFGYAAAAPYGYTAVPAKFAASPFDYGANSAKFTAPPYGNAYTAAPFYGYAAPYYGYTAPVTVGAAPVAFAAPAKFAAQTYPFAAAQAYPFVAAQTYPFGAAQTYPFGAAKQQQYAAYAPQYAGYQNTGFPYSYGYGKYFPSFQNNTAMNFYTGLIFLLQLPVHTASSFEIPQRSNPLLTCLKTSPSPIHPTLSLDFRSLPRNKLLLLIT